MKKCIIYYFSGTGNTEYVCKKITEELLSYDIDTQLIKIEKIDKMESINADLFGIAYPIHGFNAPEIIDEFVNYLPIGDTPYFIIKTSGEPLKINDASSMFFSKTLNSKKYSFIGEYHYIMPYNIIFRHSDDMVAMMRIRLNKKVKEDAKDIAKCNTKSIKYPMKAKIVAKIVRIEHPAIKLIGKGFSINKKKCIGCNKCVNNCPTQNISIVNGKFKFSSDCLGCMRCAFNCPTDAIRTGILNAWRVNGKYDFENASLSEKPKIIRYCHNSYVKYFNDDK